MPDEPDHNPTVSVDQALAALEQFVAKSVATHAAAFGARLELVEAELAELKATKAARDERRRAWLAVGAAAEKAKAMRAEGGGRLQ